MRAFPATLKTQEHEHGVRRSWGRVVWPKRKDSTAGPQPFSAVRSSALQLRHQKLIDQIEKELEEFEICGVLQGITRYCGSVVFAAVLIVLLGYIYIYTYINIYIYT